MNDRRIIIVIAIAFLLITLPFFAANVGAGSDHVFSGFLVNPYDGNSYLAKMQEGYRGEWAFTLPYTQKPGEGVYLFVFYLFLGHLARITSLPLIIAFHLTRILGFLFLAFVIYYFLRDFFNREQEKISLTFMIILLGSGLGWILIPFGIKTSDLWVAEAFPFLSSFQNPHFPIGLGLMLLILLIYHKETLRFAGTLLLLLGLLLAIILPFGVVVISIVILIEQIWAGIRKEKIHPVRLIMLALGAFPMVLYQYLTVNANPQLSVWNAQNLTPSPPVWDFLFAFSPVLVLAGLSLMRRTEIVNAGLFRTLVVWMVLGAIIIYLPIGIQRRFMVGYLIPVAILASAFLLSFKKRKNRVLGFTALLASTSLTLFFVLMAGLTAISAKNPLIFLSRPESDAIDWLNQNARGGETTLADARMGMFLPAWTNTRVLYGHPFETVNADERKQSVDDFFNCRLDPDQLGNFFAVNSVKFIVASNVNLELCYPQITEFASLEFQSGDGSVFTQIYQLP